MRAVISLPEIQRRFYNGVMDADPSALLPLLARNGLSGATRAGVYRNNAREGFRKALASAYPVVERLVGADCFRQCSWDYARRHPSRAGNLDEFGRRFAPFLEARFGGSSFDYLPDVARLEWLCQEVLLAAEAASMQPVSLARMELTDPAMLRLSIHPACRLMASDYPVMQIWKANQPGADDTGIIDLRSGRQRLLIRRDGHGIELRALPEVEFRFLACLRRGCTLGLALNAALACNAEFTPQGALTRLFALELVVAADDARRPDGAVPDTKFR